jgi:hypothetical protein
LNLPRKKTNFLLKYNKRGFDMTKESTAPHQKILENNSYTINKSFFVCTIFFFVIFLQQFLKHLQ